MVLNFRTIPCNRHKNMSPAKKPDKLSEDYADDNLKSRDTRNGTVIVIENVCYECQITVSQSGSTCIMKLIDIAL